MLARFFETARRRVTRGMSVVAIGSLAGVLIGLLLVPRAPTPDDAPPALPELSLLGHPLAVDDTTVARALERVRRYAAGRIALVGPDGVAREIYLGRLGAQIDKLRLARLVRDALDVTSPFRRVFERRGTRVPITLPVPVVVETEPAVRLLLELKDELDRLPADAKLDLDKKQLIAERSGRLLDVDATLSALRRAVEAGERRVELRFEERPPKRTRKELGNVEFDEVLGYFETNYSRSQRYEARTFNLRLAASKLDGSVLLPGEVFDFNEVVGARDEANGYKVAKVIAEGELVDGIGGGTCQISGTLHGAAFFAGLEVVERYPHTRPSSYIKMGLDATVVYPTINFRFKNPFSFPVVLHQTVKNGVVRTEVLGPERTRTVTLIRRIREAIPYDEVERPDPKLAHGKRVLGQRGVAGFKLHRYRIVRDGPHAVRERWDDVYPPTAQIIRVGTGEASSESDADDDPYAEYVADEVLVMTQGVDGDETGESTDVPRGGPTHEWREPGRFGEYGWTEKAGMPFWRGRDAKDAGPGQG